MRRCDFCEERYAPRFFEDHGDITVKVDSEDIAFEGRFDICQDCQAVLENLYTPTPDVPEPEWDRLAMRKMIDVMIIQGKHNLERAELETSKKGREGQGQDRDKEKEDQ